MEQEYYIGLDIGTSSVGWAVTDMNYQIIKRHGKALWGSRLFASANTAEERRGFRTARRRLDRRNWRINILQELFAEEISKVDSGFYLRMKESKYYPEDKKDSSGKCPELPYALFVDKDYTDKDYHKEYPTIYHLRKMLMETEKVPDIRLVYLAIHHMMKHRGHFLLSGDINQVTEFENTFLQFAENLKNEELDFQVEMSEERIKEVEIVLKDKNLTKSAKKNRLIKYFGAKSACEKAVFTLITGGTVKLSDVLGNEELNNCEKDKISFSDNNYDEYVGTVEEDLGEQFYIIESAKAVYDWSILADILGDSASISEAKVKSYEKHKEDLAYLKKVVKQYLPKEIYKKVFVITEDKLCNYPAYIGMTKINGKKVDLQGKQCSREDFLSFLKKEVVKKIEDESVKNYLSEEIEKDTFLPRQVNKDNGVIPYQIHKFELKKIIDNLSDKMPFIKENGEKIMQLFEFRIPYYVGPLGKKSEKFAWAVRKNDDKIYPWNFEQVIDVEESAEKFIRRMTNKCTYLIGEDVLPKDSLLYSKYIVLNELNNLRLGGEKISVALKQRIYEELFQRKRKVRQKDLKNYLIREGIAGKEVEISGIDGDFKGSLTAYHDFKEKLTGVELSKKEQEEIILNIVLFGDDKKLLKQRLGKRFPKLTEKQKATLASLSYSGWGRFSKKFLEEITAPAPETGEVWNIITALWESNNNLMQLLSSDYMFMESIEEFNHGKKNMTLTYETIENLYVSPAVKREIWQTLKILKEIQKVMGGEPKRVFIEMAREHQESKRTDSRKSWLMDLYKACKKEERDWLEELGQYESHQLRSDKLFLYYTQKGKCMYSGESINLEELWDNTKYDVDHIYPQSKTMDDSINNRVLVKRQYNAKKTDNYPLNSDIQEKMSSYWKMLLDGGFITKEKYERLVRKTELTPNELAGFIERQLVETRQGTKAVAEILKEAMPDTEVVYAKAKNVSEFRHEYGFIKVREMNDLHHAKDAYLNIVVGNSYYVKFTKSAANFIRENPGRSYTLKTKELFAHDIVRNDEVAWKSGNHGTMEIVEQTMKKNNILVTRRIYEVKGGLFDQQIMKKGKGQIPIKGGDERLKNIYKYGGYNKASGAYFMLVKSLDKKNNEQRTLEFLPIYMKDYVEQSEEKAQEYLVTNRKLKNPEIILPKVKIDTLFKVDGFYMWLSGRTENRLIFKCANQLILSEEDVKILKKVIKFINRKKENKDIVLNEYDGITEEDAGNLYETFIRKLKDSIYKKRLALQGEGNIFKLDKITYKSIKKIPEVNAYIEQGNRVLGILGYTEHSRGHAVKVAETAGDILEKLGYNEHTVELAQIAGYMHDMGNCVNRVDHAHSSALMAFQLLREWKVPDEDIAAIVSAIGQHDEKTGTAVDAVSAALILADKTDVRRNRVRNPIKETFDIHDRVNYAAVASSLQVNVEKKVILLEIELDEEICSILDYFEIFLQRMLMCKRAAEILGLKFKMKANGNKIC